MRIDQCGRCGCAKAADGFELCSECQQEGVRTDEQEWQMAQVRQHEDLMAVIVSIIRSAAVPS